ncbi:hypothetical protein DSL72_005897 [Monilinia vaccinii-corymbosi]|uniref:2EXR domain-containing protein n=1 Tax=Monilinia vaccinii-corymbosi TaxID=61207 RepID=A0A8A3PGC3_9HELO|nr:hypothetical protein DSL72_005897 [Monilinia vaccinii-corymbosi]
MNSFQDLADMNLDVECKPDRRTTMVITHPQTFKCFRELPPEVRTMIWEMSIEPRVLGDRPEDGRLRFRDEHHLGTSPIPRGLLPIQNTHWIPPILLACKESEEVGLKHYKNISRLAELKPIYYNPVLDSVSMIGPLHVLFPIMYQIDTDLVDRVHIPTRVVYMTASIGRSRGFPLTPHWNWAKIINQDIIQYITNGDFHISHLPIGLSGTRQRPWELIIEDLPCKNEHEIENLTVQRQWRHSIRKELIRLAGPDPFEFPMIVFKVAEKSNTVCADCRALKMYEARKKNPKKRKPSVPTVEGLSLGRVEFTLSEEFIVVPNSGA